MYPRFCRIRPFLPLTDAGGGKDALQPVNITQGGMRAGHIDPVQMLEKYYRRSAAATKEEEEEIFIGSSLNTVPHRVYHIPRE